LVVGAVISKGDKFLLLRRVSTDFMGGLVELPSGTVGADENLVTALAREVQEETGLVVDSVLKYLGSFDYRSASGKKTRQFNFFVEAPEAEIKLSPCEHDASYFVAISDAEFSGLRISEEVRAILRVVVSSKEEDPSGSGPSGGDAPSVEQGSAVEGDTTIACLNVHNGGPTHIIKEAQTILL
jgi:8-oxo-dGTP diphosphatase